MNEFDYREKNGFYCIMLSNVIDFNPFEITMKNSMQKTFLIEISNYYLHGKHNCPEIIKNFFQNQIQMVPVNPLKKFDSIENILSYCPGFIKLCYQKLNDGQTIVKTISIIFPWWKMIHDFQYIELDASFKAVKPLVFCIGQGIINNESYPFSITIAPTESTLLYDMIFEHITEISPENINWSEKPILSDMGLALKSVCEKWRLTQFLCHRHIIEHFGSSGILGILCCRLLKCYSFEKYDQIRIEIGYLLDAYIEEKKKQNNFDHECQRKVEDLRIMLDGENGDPNSNYFIFKWALWIRKDYSVGRCSNHNESLHGVINRTTKSQFKFETELRNLIYQTLAHCTGLQHRKGKSIKRKMCRYKEIITSFLSQSPTNDIFNFCKENCNCQEADFNEKIYGIRIPCIHQILTPAKEILENMISKIIKNDGNTINGIVSSILDQPYFMSKTKTNENQIAYFMNLPQPKLPKEDLILLISELKKCFCVPIPDCPDIEFDWNSNHLQIMIEESMDEPTHINDQNPKSTFHNLLFKEIDFEFADLNINHDNIAKKVLIETCSEIRNVYPTIMTVEMAIEICYEAFETLLFKQDKTIDDIVQFKISCWKKADIATNSNKFFK